MYFSLQMNASFYWYFRLTIYYVIKYIIHFKNVVHNTMYLITYRKDFTRGIELFDFSIGPYETEKRVLYNITYNLLYDTIWRIITFLIHLYNIVFPSYIHRYTNIFTYWNLKHLLYNLNKLFYWKHLHIGYIYLVNSK